VGDPPVPEWIRRLDALINWVRRNSIRVMPFNTVCCGIEFMAAFASKYDLARFGMEWLAVSPRQADVMVVGGRVPHKIAPVLRRDVRQRRGRAGGGRDMS
jgi:NADH-quinone oxidoreductase subunit B